MHAAGELRSSWFPNLRKIERKFVRRNYWRTANTGKEQSDFAESYAIGFPKAQMHYPRFNTLRTVETKSLKLYRTVNISRTPSIKCQAGGV